MHEVLPGILTDDAEMFRERFLFSGFWKPGMTAHVDILDGSMFGATCFYEPEAIVGDAHIPNIELHCMVRNPLPVIEKWKRLVPQTIRAIVHAEIDKPIDDLFHRIHALNLEFGLALCAETSVDLITSLFELPDRVLVMGVEPGTSGKPFLGDPILAKIRRLHAQHPRLHISVDGGMTKENGKIILAAGASSLVATSAIWTSDHPQESYEHLVNLS
ncbi:MAG: hypothetical protein WCT28_03480 [Patescibacteria group bacterium]|jgi:ribulose-phosphate 3-epimerase